MANKESVRLALLLACCFVLPYGMAEGKKVTLTGYLIDQMCGGGIKDVSKAKEHTKECALMDQCAQSGHGIFADGKFVNFDPAGSGRAKDLLDKSATEKDIQVIVEGTQDGDVLSLTSIQEK